MNKFNDFFQSIINHDILFESKKQALLKWKNQQNVQQYIEKFMNKHNGIRLKVASPYNDIDYWHSKKTFNEFKQFIDIFESKKEIKQKKKHHITVTDDGNGKLIDSINEYQIWFVNSAEAAKQLGRFYKGRSTKWCISTDKCDYYWNNDHKNDTFYFLIRKELKNDDFDKLAFEFKATGEIKIWDLNNRKNTFHDETVISYMKNNFKWIDKITDAERYFLNPVKIEKNNDGTVNIYGSIYLDELGISQFPWKNKFKIKQLFGSLYIQYNLFESFENCPEIIHGDFDYSNNPIKSFNHFPKVEGIVYEI